MAAAHARCNHTSGCSVCSGCNKQICRAHMYDVVVSGAASSPRRAARASPGSPRARPSAHPAPAPLQPAFDAIQAILRVMKRSPWASAKACTFCSALYCFDCEPNTFCSHEACGRLACPADADRMFWCATCEKHYCRTCRPPVNTCGHNVCGVGACAVQPCATACRG